MVSTCCICKRRFDAIVNGKKLSMHRFPKNEEQRGAWRKRFKRFGSLKNLLVCSLHFSESESVVVGKRVFKRIAVPKDPGIIQKSKEKTTWVILGEHNYSKVKTKTLQYDNQATTGNNTNFEQKQRNYQSVSHPQTKQMQEYNCDLQPIIGEGGYTDTRPTIEIHGYNDLHPENDSQPDIEIHGYNDSQPKTKIQKYSNSQPYLEIPKYIDPQPEIGIHRYNDLQPYNELQKCNDLQPHNELQNYNDLQPHNEVQKCNDSQPHLEIPNYNDSQPQIEIQVCNDPQHHTIDKVLESLQMQSLLKPEEFQEIFMLVDDNLKHELTGTNEGYSEKLKQFAIYLYCYSMKAYRYAQMYLTLPDIDTVKYWLENLPISTPTYEGYGVQIDERVYYETVQFSEV